MVREIPWGSLDRIADPQPEPWEQASAHEEEERYLPRDWVPYARVRIGLTPTWGAAIAQYQPAPGQPCPACGSTPEVCTLRSGEVCLVCHTTRRSPHQWPMQAPIGRVRTRRKRLKGGVGA